MNTPNIESHPKLKILEWLRWKKITVTSIHWWSKEVEEWFFQGFWGRWITLTTYSNDPSEQSWDIPLIGYENAVVVIEDSEWNQVYNNATEGLIDFYRKDVATFFEGADWEGIVAENNRRVNEILDETFWDLYPKLEMVR